MLEFPRFDLHVLLNSIIINHQKAKFLTVCTHVSAVWIVFIGIDSFLFRAPKKDKWPMQNPYALGF